MSVSPCILSGMPLAPKELAALLGIETHKRSALWKRTRESKLVLAFPWIVKCAPNNKPCAEWIADLFWKMTSLCVILKPGLASYRQASTTTIHLKTR